MNETVYINLSQFKSSRANIMLGRKMGEYARLILKLDEVDQLVKKNPKLEIEFQFPDEVYTINDSFFKGLLDTTFKTLGYDTFKARVRFYTNNEVLKQKLDSDINNFINLLREINS